MGQKANPNVLRLGIINTWSSRWYADKKAYGRYIGEDIKIRRYVFEKLSNAAIAKIEIERAAAKLTVIIHSAKPGLVIGKKGKDIDDLRNKLRRLVNRKVSLNIVETRKPDSDAQLLADNVANQLKRRINYRRAAKDVVAKAMRTGAEGVKIAISGRLNGADIARSEFYKDGRIPLHTFRADIDYATSGARTTYGVVGVKVWVFKGEKFAPGQAVSMEAMQQI